MKRSSSQITLVLLSSAVALVACRQDVPRAIDGTDPRYASASGRSGTGLTTGSRSSSPYYGRSVHHYSGGAGAFSGRRTTTRGGSSGFWGGWGGSGSSTSSGPSSSVSSGTSRGGFGGSARGVSAS